MIDLNEVVVKWPSADEAEDNTLTDVSFSVKSGQLLAVVGQVGSGKVLHFLYMFLKHKIVYLNQNLYYRRVHC